MKFKNQKLSKPLSRQATKVDKRQPAAFSYYARRSERNINTGRTIGRDNSIIKINWFAVLGRRIGLIILAIVIVAAVIKNLTITATPNIIPLSSGGNQYFLHGLSTYSQATASILRQSIWNNNKLTINTDAVAQKLKQLFPELSSVSVVLPILGQRPEVYIQPNQPALILHTTDNGSYVLDQNGTALIATQQLPKQYKATLIVVNDQSGLKVAVGKQALTSDNVSFIQQVVLQLSVHKVVIKTLILPSAASELDATVVNQPYYVKFNMHASVQDARQQAGTFIAAEHYLAGQHIVPSSYIDVRSDNRAYYL